MAAVARDPDAGFYRGPLADRIAADMAAGDGLITAADLAAYRVETARRWRCGSGTGSC